MNDSTQFEIDRITRDFVSKIEGAIRASVYASVEQAFSGAAAARAASSVSRAPQAAPRARASSSSSGGGRRSPEQLDALVSKVRDYIASNPGQGAEQIGAALGLRTKELQLPMIKLIKERVIRRKGERRGTRYSIA